MLFPNYNLENRETHQVIVLDGASYVWAGLFACFYVLWRTDFSSFRKAFAVNLLFVAAIVASVSLASSLPAAFALMAAALSLVLIVQAQSRIMLGYVRLHYARRGWAVSDD